MTEVVDLRAEAAELFAEATAKIAAASPAQMEGPNRLLPRLLASEPGDPMRVRMEALGLEISTRVTELLVEIGEADLIDDVGAVGFIACASLGLVVDDEEHSPDDPPANG
jgi:hypothetical protein